MKIEKVESGLVFVHNNNIYLRKKNKTFNLTSEFIPDDEEPCKIFNLEIVEVENKTIKDIEPAQVFSYESDLFIACFDGTFVNLTQIDSDTRIELDQSLEVVSYATSYTESQIFDNLENGSFFLETGTSKIHYKHSNLIAWLLPSMEQLFVDPLFMVSLIDFEIGQDRESKTFGDLDISDFFMSNDKFAFKIAEDKAVFCSSNVKVECFPNMPVQHVTDIWVK